MKFISIGFMITLILAVGYYLFSFPVLFAQSNINIHVNQVGYHPNSPKIAVATQTQNGQIFKIQSIERDITYYSGIIEEKVKWEVAGEEAGIIDFSDFTRVGKYVIVIEDKFVSPEFELKGHTFLEIHKASLKAFYFQRASMPIEEKFGGKWSRPAGHPDNKVIIHESAANNYKPKGSIISATGGWYDAGDYGKYTVNAAVSTAYLLALYERSPSMYDTLKVNIPTSKNALGDLLEECYYNLLWLRQMQEPQSGMVYHKLTSLEHASICMPHQDTTQRFMIGKSTAANLDFAAVMALASRVYKNKLPNFSNDCLDLAQKAWAWALLHPNSQFENPNDVHSGAYRDDYLKDEWIWAATELFITTQDPQYLSNITLNGRYTESPNWLELGYFSLIQLSFHQSYLKEYFKKLPIELHLLSFANEYIKDQKTNPYNIPFGDREYDFIVGSNSKIAGNGLLLLEAHRITNKEIYLNSALACLDYILGRNPTGYCYVSGFGSLSPKHIHHRPSQADGVKPPIPGFVVGGANGKSLDPCTPSGPPAKAYLDDWCSHTTNEVTINWNAPFVFLSGMIEKELKE